MTVNKLINKNFLMEIKNLSVNVKKAPDVFLLKNVCMRMANHEHIGLVGASGSGKTTLIEAMLGLLDSNLDMCNGRVSYFGQDFFNMSDQEQRHIRGNKVALITQNPREVLDPLCSIYHHFYASFKAHRSGGSDHDIKSISRASLLQVGLDPKMLFRYPLQLSGGECQRVVIALALFNKPKILIADEPTSSLDRETSQKVISLIRELCDEVNTQLLWITHDLFLLKSLVNKIYIISSGKIVEKGDVKQIFEKASHNQTKKMMASLEKLYGTQ